MNLILLSGASFKNKAWIEQVETALRPLFATTKVVYYDHWQTGGEELDQQKELPKLEQIAAGLDQYSIFAKSAGSWLVLRAIYEGKVKPEKLVIVGPAWNWARNNGFDPGKLAKQISVPVLVIDKTADPSLPFAQLQSEVNGLGLSNFKLVEVPGDTHHYEDVVGLSREIRKFLAT